MTAELRVGSLLVFLLDAQRYGLPLEGVEHVVRAVRVTPLPRAPRIVTGVIDFRGLIVPVFDLRARLGLAAKPLAPSDCLVIARCRARVAALVVDAVAGAESGDWRVSDAEAIVPGLEGINGVARTADGIILIHDLDRFLSPQEERALEDALDNG